MIDSSALLADLKAQLKTLQADLRQVADDSSTDWGAQLQREHSEALRRERTGLAWTAWRDNEVDQAAVAWIVATTFIRFCEDNDLLVGATLDGLPTPVGWIAGPGDRTKRAVENQTAYFRANPTHNRRDWLQQAFRVLAAQPAGEGLVDPNHNPVWTAEISAEAATGLADFWRRTNDEGELVHDFTDPELDTRFLGDLYQDLSEHARKTYALLQTPVFVEEFILDQTLTPAIAEFGLKGLKLIDPTCGSGHFLLGAFERLNQRWAAEAPRLDPKQRVRHAMDSIHGVDLNPFAVAIARFRLTVAGVKAAGETSLIRISDLGFHLAIGDSLLGARRQGELDYAEDKEFAYGTEDVAEYGGILDEGRYHVVVGNPPYITVKDKILNVAYRKAYPGSTKGKYALSAPFMELLFRLAHRDGAGGGAGYVGQITSNSFMKREFGKKVIEGLLSGNDSVNPVDLTAVIDTSGAYIPGHGTPTVILVGRRRRPVGESVRAVLGVRGEPGQPGDPSRGLVWTEIVDHLGDAGFNGAYISVVDLQRRMLSTHPWSLSGGGAGDLMEEVESARHLMLVDAVDSIGFAAITGDDDVFVRRVRTAATRQDNVPMRRFVEGTFVRDFEVHGNDLAVFPYPVAQAQGAKRVFWPFRTVLRNGLAFGKTREEKNMWWGEYILPNWPRLRADHLITFAFVATHNHFVLDRGGKVFKQSAPVIKLPADATEDDHLDLLGVLNSSTACFWLKQVSHNKGEGGGARVEAGYAAMGAEEWRNTYEFTGTKLQEFPLPAECPREGARVLDKLAQALAQAAPAASVTRLLETGEGVLTSRIALAHAEWDALRRRMIFQQEELDWETYRLYGLVDEDLTYSGTGITEIDLGERAFEVVLARTVERGDEETTWFERHGSAPVTELPSDWPEDYRELVQRRLVLIEADPFIKLLERPEYKRRWVTEGWDTQLRAALQSAILDRLEAPDLWQDFQGPTTRSVAQLADLLRNDTVLGELAQVLTGNTEPNLVAVIDSLALGEGVPYLAAHRYKPSGLEKFREWQRVWDLQRREDAGEKVSIPVPPKYSTPDFRKLEYWKARGKLDVPKERFILYPGLAHEGDTTPVLGWAGWDHRDQAVALMREVLTQQALGAPEDTIVPMVAGLVELEPWLHQWHTEIEPEFGTSAAQAVSGQVDQLLARLRLTRDDVNAWRPPAATRGRRKRS